MAQILAWRSSPLADVGRHWIELPPPGAELPPNRSYSGPLPDAPVARAAATT